MGIQDQIDRAEDKITALEVKLNNLTELFMRDGSISASEGRALERVNAKIRPLAAQVDRLYERLDAQNLEQGVVEFRDDEALEVTVDTDREFGDAKYFNDDYFKSRFKQSIVDWTQDGGLLVTSVSSYMNRAETPAGLSVMDLLPVLGLIFPQSLLVTRALTLSPIAVKAFETGLRACSGSTPSLNEIHAAWMGALLAMRKDSELEKQYNLFVASWKSQEGIGSDVEQAWTNVFGPACSNFADNHMPKSSDIQKAFMGKIISTTEDSMDYGDDAGDADMEIMELVNNWSSPEGQLDDVPEAMLGAVKTVFARSRVIDLPVKISIIVRNNMGANMCEIKRSSRTAGSTDFSYVDGDRDKFDNFMSGKIYNKFYVHHLSLDT